MKKIPVLDTIRYAYGFTFGHLGTIIGLIWVPMLIVAVPGYFVASHYYEAFPAAVSEGNPAAMSQAVLAVLMWSLVSLLFSSVMYVAVTRQALGLRKGPAVVHFALGGAEFRVFGAITGLLAIAMLFLMVDGIVVTLLRKLAGEAAAGVAALVILVAIVYALVRLSFLLIATTVAEEKIGLVRAWQLSGWNFWRIVAIGLAVLGPLALIVVAIQVAILGPDFYLHQPAMPAADDAARLRDMAEQMRNASQHLPVLSGVSFVLAPLFLGLGLAPGAFAYLALTAPERPNSGFPEQA